MKVHTVMTRGVAEELSAEEKFLILLKVVEMGKNSEPEPSMFILDPDFKESEQKLEDEGRTVRFPFDGHRKVWIKKDDFRGCEVEDKVAWGVEADTNYIITALFPEEY